MIPFIHPSAGPLKLGRLRASPHTLRSAQRFLRLHSFMSALPNPPSELDNSAGITSWGMMLNDSLRDCTCAACGHMIQSWTADSGSEVTVPDSAVLAEYEGACGYNPSDPATDQGGIISNVLDYFEQTGVGGHKITAHAPVNLTQLRVQQGVQVFGAVDIGVQLPLSAQNQVGSTWDFVNDQPDTPGGWGGHSVAIVKYAPDLVWCVTWGALQAMTWRWFMYYVDEGHACISPDYTASPIPTLLLAEDLSQIGN